MKQKIQQRRWYLAIFLFVLASIVLVACQPKGSQQVESEPPPAGVDQPLEEQAPSQQPDANSEDQDLEYELALPGISTVPDEVDESANVDPYPAQENDLPTATVEPEITLTPEPTETPESQAEIPTDEPKPTSRGSALVASDPSTVSLASGKLQLVEFFAFW